MSRPLQAYELLMVGVGQLVTGTGTIQDRLQAAVSEFHELQEDDFPDHQTRHKYSYLVQALGIKGPARAELGSAALAFSDHDASALARRIYDLFLDVAQSYFGAK